LFSTNEWEIIKLIESLRESGVERVCPCHCSGDLAKSLLREAYGGEYIEGGVGRVIGVH
jgi:7,8-dihydropterin-6-yl-methyl-4-(beta-D-ribofuranosyl)aminobenzene 5'-phosphate synthase